MEIEDEEIPNKVSHEKTCVERMKSNPIDKYWAGLIF